jgi:hypothetical protein
LISRLVTAALAAVISSGAAVANAAPPQGETHAEGDSRVLPPLHLDARITAHSDILLAYFGAGASADFGLVQIGPGTLAVGAGVEYDACGSVCWLFSAVTPLEFTHQQISPQARASYHLALGRSKNLDFYPLVTGGPVLARSTVGVDGGAATYRGTDTAIGVAAGVGFSLFIAGPVFLGGEGRLRYARGTYSYELVSGDERTFARGEVDSWSLSGLEIIAGLGVRIP